MRLFRQKQVSDWEPVFAQLAAELHHLAASHSSIDPKGAFARS
jgi:hypothetical protein